MQVRASTCSASIPAPAQRFLYQPAGKTFPEPQQMVLRLRIQPPRGCEIEQQRFQFPKLAAQFAIERTVSGIADQRVCQSLMPNINAAHRREGRAQMALRSRSSSLLQLVGNPGQRADHDHRLRTIPAPHDADDPPNGGRILHRRASELHHHHVVTSVESAPSLESRSMSV
jgi:hypothetical protein